MTRQATEHDPASRFRLDDRVAVVTGASSGIGAQLTCTLHDLGATVIAVARREERLHDVIRDRPRCHAIPTDLAASGAGSRLIEQIVQTHGRVDVLIANAAITSVAPALREDPATFADVVDFDLVRVYEIARSAAAAMREGGGAMVFTSSVAAHRVQPALPTAAYTAAKAGLEGLSRELASQWSRYGIRVNCIAPGVFPTEMTSALVGSDELRAATESKIPLGRIGELRDLDGPVALLCSDAGAFITGQTIIVDGGWSL